jgi:hypothetical protein
VHQNYFENKGKKFVSPAWGSWVSKDAELYTDFTKVTKRSEKCT